MSRLWKWMMSSVDPEEANSERTVSTQVPDFFPEWAKNRKRNIVLGIIFSGLLWVICILIFTPIAVTMYQSDGKCFLYADAYGFGANSICDYCIAVAVILFILCVFRFVMLAFKFLSMSDRIFVDKVKKYFSLYGVHIIIMALDVVLLLLLLIMSCILSVGLGHLCNNLFGSRSKCSDTDGVILPNERVNRSFYTALSISEASSWIGFCIWLIVVIYEVYVGRKIGTLEFIFKREATSTTSASTRA